METIKLPKNSYHDSLQQCLLDINSGLEFKPVSIEVKKPLISDIDIVPIEFDLEFSQPVTRLKNFFAATTSLNVLSKTSIDFSEMLSFQNATSCNENVKSPSNQHVKIDNGLELLPDVDNKLIPKTSIGIFCGFLGKKTYRAKIMKNLFLNEKSNGFCSQPDENFRKNHLIDFQSKRSIGKLPI